MITREVTNINRFKGCDPSAYPSSTFINFTFHTFAHACMPSIDPTSVRDPYEPVCSVDIIVGQTTPAAFHTQVVQINVGTRRTQGSPLISTKSYFITSYKCLYGTDNEKKPFTNNPIYHFWWQDFPPDCRQKTTTARVEISHQCSSGDSFRHCWG